MESGKFSKFIMSHTFLENLSGDGSLLYGDVLSIIGVPRATDFTVPREGVVISELIIGISFSGVKIDSSD